MIEDLAFGGRGVARHEGLVFFIEGALPGESVRVRVRRKRSGFAEAELLQVLSRSPDRTVPPCDHYGECGG
ncbi:MAG TPA: TRAM domain-containing protein, partial [Candidatus Polarisedimenticolia bacterium]